MAINFSRYLLKNGLTLITHEDATTPLVACNVVYKVGSRDEKPSQTGMAHLFEHFMFSGSKNINNYDQQLQQIGGINNAYTTQDITHYYCTLPANNLETALWLESDRMLDLPFNNEQLAIQKNVVIEEFKENFLNRPYGDLWLIYNDFIYEKHPYKWLPIGKNISHIENIGIEDVKKFYSHFYCPNNAILTISGNIKMEQIIPWVEKWFGDIPIGNTPNKLFDQELPQQSAKKLEVYKDVPNDMLIKGWKMCDRLSPEFYAYDLLSDLFGNGQSSYLYQTLVTDKQIFSDITSYISGTRDAGIWIVGGRPADGISIEKADDALNNFLYNYKYDERLTYDLQKVKNRVESLLLANEIEVKDRSSILAVTEATSCIEDFENDCKRYFDVTEEDIISLTKQLFLPETSNTLYYRAKQNHEN